MKVIMLKDVKGVGKVNQIIEVKDGYASNYLLPNRLAVKYTERSIEVLEDQKKNEQLKIADLTKKAQEKPELFFICKCIEAEITDSLNNAQEEGERVHHLQILEQKIQHALEHERNLIKRNYEKLFDFIREDLIEYKTLIKSSINPITP